MTCGHLRVRIPPEMKTLNYVSKLINDRKAGKWSFRWAKQNPSLLRNAVNLLKGYRPTKHNVGFSYITMEMLSSIKAVTQKVCMWTSGVHVDVRGRKKVNTKCTAFIIVIGERANGVMREPTTTQLAHLVKIKVKMPQMEQCFERLMLCSHSFYICQFHK